MISKTRKKSHMKYELEADEATTVPEAGWASKTNGELLSLAETDFDVFLTRDQNLELPTKPEEVRSRGNILGRAYE